jgi:hypothetical protein
VFAADGVTIAADIVDNMADYVFEENPLIKVSFKFFFVLVFLVFDFLSFKYSR